MSGGFQSTASDVALEGNREVALEETHEMATESEVENAKCECCGMCEECSHEYIGRVRGMFSGNMICGLCAEAVHVEMEKNGGKREKALEEHMSDCVKFNWLGRSYPALYRAEDVKEILKKTLRCRAMSSSSKDSKGI